MKRAPLVVIWLFAIQALSMQLAFSQHHQKAKRHPNIKPSIFPALPKLAKRLEDFVPKGWKIKDTITGDLNSDKAADLVMVLEGRHRATEHGEDTHPRILIIAFNAGSHYDLKLQQNNFILRSREMYDTDPYKDITIAKGMLYIHFDLLHDGGEDKLLYMIKYQLNDFYLVGATRTSRSDGGYERSSDFNFSTRKYVYRSSFPNGYGKRHRTRQKNLPPHVLKKLSELYEPLTWEVFDDEVI
jgi:hypothetical protein